jgi:hypothetical protein
MYELEKAVQEKPVTIKSVYIGEENHWDDKTVQDHFVVTLEYQGRKMEGIDYYMGIGHRVNQKGERLPIQFGRKTLYDVEQEKSYKPRKPKVEEVLNCLLLDSTATDLTFDEWCGELGYDTDSRKAEKTFNLCNEQGKLLKRLLGEEYDYFMEHNEY